MEPKDKAIELVKKFYPFTYTAVHNHKTPFDEADAKQCALIAVDEIIRILQDEQDWYWPEVKQEIEKL
jgi:hypothetical protein